MGLKFLKTGAEAQAVIAQAEAEVEARKELNENRVFRFYLPQDKETQITFLDGDLADNGILETVAFWEHQVKLNGSWKNWFPCVKDVEPCPVCEDGDRPSLVRLFTVIDHSMWKDKNDIVHQHERKLFVCKHDVYKRLQKLATKRSGLAGCSFDVSRIGDKSAAVGSDFDFIEKKDLSAIRAAYGDDKVALNYEDTIKYYDAKQLTALGFGSGSPSVGSEDTSALTAPTNTDYSAEL